MIITVLILSNANSSHTLKWVRGLSQRGINIILYSLSRVENMRAYSKYDNVIIKHSNISSDIFNKSDGAFTKAIFLKSVPLIRKVISKYKPDILHAHYATTYGSIGSLSGFPPFLPFPLLPPFPFQVYPGPVQYSPVWAILPGLCRRGRR